MHKQVTRREFISRTTGVCALTPFALDLGISAPPVKLASARRGLPNPFVENGKPVVVLVHGTDFVAMLAKGMDLLGGFSRYGTHHAVHIKPNFVAPSPYPVTTAGPSILSTIELLQKDGFKQITVAEWSSGTGHPGQTRAFEMYDLPEKAQRGGFGTKDLFDDEITIVQNNDWKAVPNVGVRKSVFDIPLIINMPTLKQHSGVQFTCALKNTMGQISAQTRRNMHRMEIEHENEDAGKQQLMSRLAVAEIASAINPDLTIIDARNALGKNHHLNRGGVLIKPNCIIVSGNALAADIVGADVLSKNYDGFEVAMATQTFEHAATLGMGPATKSDIVLKEAIV